jgi:hypothetical protein
MRRDRWDCPPPAGELQTDAPVDQAFHFSGGVVMKQDPAFDAFAEKEIGSFGEQLFLLVQLFLFAFAFDE